MELKWWVLILGILVLGILGMSLSLFFVKADTDSAGPRGPAGINGTNGTNGIDGTNGTNGIDGTNGINGDPGPKGDQGIQGIQGDKGDKGDKGDTGASGGTTSAFVPFNFSAIQNQDSITFTSGTSATYTGSLQTSTGMCLIAVSNVLCRLTAENVTLFQIRMDLPAELKSNDASRIIFSAGYVILNQNGGTLTATPISVTNVEILTLSSVRIHYSMRNGSPSVPSVIWTNGGVGPDMNLNLTLQYESV